MRAGSNQMTENGATVFEFVLVIPVLLLFVLAIISFGIRYHGEAILSKGLEEGLNLASVEPGLEDVANNDSIEERILERALEFPVRAFFQDATGPGGAEEGTRITSIELDIGEDTEATDLTDHFAENPIVIRATAVIRNPIPFFPDWRVTVTQAANREPRFVSTVPRVTYCDGSDLAFGGVPPGTCPCVSALDDPRITANSSGACSCVAAPGVGFIGGEGGEFVPGACGCTDPLRYRDHPNFPDNLGCVCKSCVDIGHDESAIPLDGFPACSCKCPENFTEIRNGDGTLITECRCQGPYGYNVETGDCECALTCNPGEELRDDCTCEPLCEHPFVWQDGECVCDPEELAACTANGSPYNEQTCECLPPCSDLGTCDLNPPQDKFELSDNQCICNTDCMETFCNGLGHEFLADDHQSCACDPCSDDGVQFDFPTDYSLNSDGVCACQLTGNICLERNRILRQDATNCRCIPCEGNFEPNSSGTECECPFTEQVLEAQCAQSQQQPDLANCACTPCPQGTQYVPGGDPLCQCPYYNENFPDGPECPEGEEQFNPGNCSCCPAGKIFQGGQCVCDPEELAACTASGSPYDEQTCQCLESCESQGTCGSEPRWELDGNQCVCNTDCMETFCNDLGHEFLPNDYQSCACDPCSDNGVQVDDGFPEDYSLFTFTIPFLNLEWVFCACQLTGSDCLTRDPQEPQIRLSNSTNCRCIPCEGNRVPNQYGTACICPSQPPEGEPCNGEWNTSTCECDECDEGYQYNGEQCVCDRDQQYCDQQGQGLFNPATCSCCAPDEIVEGGQCVCGACLPNEIPNLETCQCTPCPGAQVFHVGVSGGRCYCPDPDGVATPHPRGINVGLFRNHYVRELCIEGQNGTYNLLDCACTPCPSSQTPSGYTYNAPLKAFPGIGGENVRGRCLCDFSQAHPTMERLDSPPQCGYRCPAGTTEIACDGVPCCQPNGCPGCQYNNDGIWVPVE